MHQPLKKDIMYEELNHLQNWLQTILPNQAPYTLTPLLGDAGLRRYFRLTQTGEPPKILVEIPPGPECGKRFIEIQEALQNIGLRVPQILAKHQTTLLLLEDLGDNLLFNILRPDTAQNVYRLAIDDLLPLQTIETLPETVPALEHFNEKWLEQECLAFEEWFLKKLLHLELTPVETNHLHDFFHALIHCASQQKQVFIHRDYHSKNLFLLPDETIGIIDFQDAMTGPLTYDLASLIKDCYVNWPPEQVKSLAQYYFNQSPHQSTYDDFDGFYRDFEWMGAQRHIKAIFIFARKYLRDDNPSYLQYIPRTLNYLKDFCDNYQEASDFKSLLEKKILPAWQHTFNALEVDV
jgi:N-acetylmuramate 1-kinase